MVILSSDAIKSAESMSLHDKRFREMQYRSLMKGYNSHPTKQNNFFNKNPNKTGTLDDKDITVDNLEYYSIEAAVTGTLSKFSDKILNNINKVKSWRESHGQRIATDKDINEVKGEWPEENLSKLPQPSPRPLVIKRVVRTFKGYSLVMEIVVADTAFFPSDKRYRRGYSIQKMELPFYLSNGVGLRKQIILRENLFRLTRKKER